MKKITKFDYKEYFDENCKPLLDELVTMCGRMNVPFFFCAAVSNDEDKTEYIADGIMTGSRNIVLKDDHIRQHMLVNNGFIARPSATEIDMSPELFMPDDLVDE